MVERTLSSRLLLICGVGGVVFGAVLLQSVAARPALERAASAFLRREVERELRARLDLDVHAANPALNQRLLEEAPAEAKEYAIVRAEPLREHVRASAASDEPPLTDTSERVYRRRLDALVRELQLFAVSNLALFAGIAAVCVWRRDRAASLILPAAIVTATTLAAAVLYALAQDWLWAFLTGEYIGVYYLVSIGGVSALLMDIACNRARVSAVIARALWYWPM